MALATGPNLWVEIDFLTDPRTSNLQANVTQVAAADAFDYIDLTNVPDYIVQQGDYLEYEVNWLASGNLATAIDLKTSDGLYLGTITPTVTDQNGRAAFPGTDLSSVAFNAWYHRTIPIPDSWIGKTIQKFMIACEDNSTLSGGVFVRFRDIAITDGNGKARQVIWVQGDGPPSQFTDKTSNAGNSIVLSVLHPNRTWTNVSQYVLGRSMSRGSQNELQASETGSETLRLNNDDGRFQPNNSSSPYYPNVKPARYLRVRGIYPTNLMPDGGFDSGVLTPLSTDQFVPQPEEGWVYGVTASTTFSVPTTSPPPGETQFAQVAITALTATYIYSAPIPIDPARAFTLSYWLKLVAGSGTNNSFAQVDCFGWDGTLLSTINLGPNFTPTGTWTRVQPGTVAPASWPAGTNYVRVRLYLTSSPSANMTVGIGAVQFEQGGTMTTYVQPTIYHRFRGIIERWPPGSEGRHSTVELTANDGLGLLSVGVIPAKFYASDFSGNQAAAILADTGWDGGTAIDVGNATVQSFTSQGDTEGEALTQLQALADAELGLFYVDGAGVANFEARSRRVNLPQIQNIGTFANAPVVANMLGAQDPSFETSGLPFVVASSGTATRISNAGEPFTDGSFEAQFVPSATNGYIKPLNNVTGLAEGETYTWSAYVNAPAGKTYRLAILWLDVLGNGTGSSFQDFVGLGAQVRRSVTAVAPAGTYQAFLQVQVTDASLPTIKVEAWMFNLGNLQPYTNSATVQYLYLAPAPSYDEERIINHAATRPSGATTWEQVDDLVSRRNYGRRAPNSIREPVISTDAEALNQSYLLVNRFSQPLLRFDSIVLDPKRQSILWPIVLNVDISDRLTLIYKPLPSAATIQVDMYVEHVQEDVSFDRGQGTFTWTTTIALSPADPFTYWILDSPTYSILGSTTRLFA